MFRCTLFVCVSDKVLCALQRTERFPISKRQPACSNVQDGPYQTAADLSWNQQRGFVQPLMTAMTNPNVAAVGQTARTVHRNVQKSD